LDKELADRLIKIADLPKRPTRYQDILIFDTIATLEAIRAHQCAMYPYRDGESLVLDEAIELVKDYR